MHGIAWLLTQRAVRAGELTRAEAATSERRLGDAAPVDAELLTRLPEQAVEIIQASSELYERVGRLDREPIGEDALPSPARGLRAGWSARSKACIADPRFSEGHQWLTR